MLAASTMWGAMAPVSKYVMSAGLIGSIVVTDVRIFGAAVLFWVFSLFTGGEKVDRKDYLKMFFAGLFAIVLNQGVYITGVSMTSPVDASIITTSLPIVTMIFAAIWLKEPITVMKAGGVLLGLGGALLLVFGNRLMPGAGAPGSASAGSSNLLGDLLCFCAQCSYAVYLVLFKDLIVKYSGCRASGAVRRPGLHTFLRYFPVLSPCACRPEEPSAYACGDVQLCAACSSYRDCNHLGHGQLQHPESPCRHPRLLRCPACEPRESNAFTNPSAVSCDTVSEGSRRMTEAPAAPVK